MSDEQQSVLKLLVELVDKVTGPLRAISENFEEFESGIWDLSRAFGSAFVGWELFEHLAEPAAKFQEAQAMLAIATHGSAEELKAFKEQAEELSQAYPSDIENVTAAQLLLYQTFRDQSTVLAATENADRLATALGWDASTAANILASAYENLAPKGSDVSKEMQSFADKLVVLNTEFPSITANSAMMARDFARLGASAKTYGIGINQVLALLGELNQLHAGGTRGAGMIAQEMVRSLAEVDKNGAPTLARYGMVIEKDRQGNIHLIATLERLAKMARDQPRAFHGLLEHLPEEGQYIAQLVDHIGDLESAYHDFADATGAADKAVTVQNETFENAQKRFGNSLENLKELLGILALPALTHTTDNLVKVVTAVEKLADKHPGVAKIAADFALMGSAAITVVGALGFVGKLIEFIGTTGLKWTGILSLTRMLGTAFMALRLYIAGAATAGEALTFAFESNPIGWIITIVSGLIIGGYEVYRHWAQVVEVFHELKTAAEDLFNFLEHSTGLDKLHFLADILQGNFAGAGIDFALATPPSAGGGAGSAGASAPHYHYSPQVTIHMAPGGDANDTAKAVQSVLEGHASEFWESASDQRQRENRLTFQSPTSPFFAR
jgi:TP901 family phage tail tape measure protein